jgi:uncharacterized repeat protein (TIGR03803 family)
MSPVRRVLIVSVVMCVAGGRANDASAQSFEIVASQFGPVEQRGIHPNAGLIFGRDGNYYGTTSVGGEFGYGTVFKMTSDGSITLLHSFDNTDGANPSAPVIEGLDGALYGTTDRGGAGGVGTVFTLAKDGSGFTVLHSLAPQDTTSRCFPEGAGIRAPVVQGINGLFGVVASGGCSPNTNAAFFRIDPTGTNRFHIVGHVPDTGADSGLTRGADGFFYGIATGEGLGKIYRISEDGTATVLHTLTREQGFGHDLTEMVQASDGRFYGTASNGGTSDCGLESCGTVFQFDAATSTYRTMHSFGLNDPAGRYPLAGLVEGSDGWLYGTTAVTTPSGADCCGAAFRINPLTDEVTLLHTFFGDSSGSSPRGRLIEPTSGQFVGTTYSGGFGGDSGVVFRLTVGTNAPQTSTSIAASPTASVFGQQVSLIATVTSGGGTPTGLVDFREGAASLGTALLSGGSATLSTTNLAVGTHTLTASYQGDGTFLASTSQNVPVTVGRAATTTSLASTPNPSARKQVVSVTATVAAVAPGAGTASGLVQFSDGKKKLGTASLVNGAATLQVAFNSMGGHGLTATYGGDGNFAPSASPTFTHMVNR